MGGARSSAVHGRVAGAAGSAGVAEGAKKKSDVIEITRKNFAHTVGRWSMVCLVQPILSVACCTWKPEQKKICWRFEGERAYGTNSTGTQGRER